jgi:hypothetical protein
VLGPARRPRLDGGNATIFASILTEEWGITSGTETRDTGGGPEHGSDVRDYDPKSLVPS